MRCVSPARPPAPDSRLRLRVCPNSCSPISYTRLSSLSLSYLPPFILHRIIQNPSPSAHQQNSPRAAIFRRDQAAARDLAAFKRLMRANDWQRDPLSEGAPFAAVCARGDLAPAGAEFGPVLKGCYDSKVTSATLARALRAEVVSGPTAQGQPPFEWAGRWAGAPHRGMAARFDFAFEAQAPGDLPLDAPACGGGAGSGSSGGGGLSSGGGGGGSDGGSLEGGGRRGGDVGGGLSGKHPQQQQHLLHGSRSSSSRPEQPQQQQVQQHQAQQQPQQQEGEVV